MDNAVSSAYMQNKICLITGGTSGVGRAIAEACARAKATVIITSRQAEKAGATARELQKITGNRIIIGYAVDLADPDSIFNFVQLFRKEYNALHVLSNNAAILTPKKKYTATGIEEIFAVNYLGHFLLVHLLKPLLIESAPSRVLTVTGNPGIIQNAVLDIDDLNLDRQHYNPIKATIRAALAKTAFSYELANQLKNDAVTSNTFHPGLVRTNLPQILPQPFKLAAQFSNLFLGTQCKTGAFLATSPNVEKTTGKVFNRSQIVSFKPRIPLQSYSKELWEKSKALTKLEL